MRRCDLVHTVAAGRRGMLAPASPPAPRRGEARRVRMRRGATTKGQAMKTTGATTVDADLDLDLKLGEQYYKDDKEFEHKAIEALVDLIHKSIERRFREGSGPAHRDAHAGDNGCVRAIFRVDPDLDREL